MKKLGIVMAGAAAFALTASSAHAGLLISEVADGTLLGGQPKFLELSNTGPGSVDLSEYRIALYSNGSVVESTFTPMSFGDMTGILAAGASYVVANPDSTDASNEYDATFNPAIPGVFNAAPDVTAGNINNNGDDVYQLFQDDGIGGDVLRDAYGTVGVDGTGFAWEFTDGYAYRKLSSSPNTTFTESEWFFGGVDSIQSINQTDPEEIALMRSVLTPGYFLPEPATLGLLAIGGLFVMRRRS